MSTALANIPNQLPAHILARGTQGNAAAMGGIKAGGFASIGTKGGKFFLKNEGEMALIVDPNNPELPKMQLELTVVGTNPMLNKIYYGGEWIEGAADEPDCSSDDGITPDGHITTPQAAACATCPQNVWGSKISPQGKSIKACSDHKRLVMLRTDDLKGLSMALTVPPSGLKAWGDYVRKLDAKGINVMTVSTKVRFDPTASHPKLIFDFDRFLSEEELAIVDQRAQSDEVRLIAMPRKSTPQAPAGSTLPSGIVVPAQPVVQPAVHTEKVADVAPVPTAQANLTAALAGAMGAVSQPVVATPVAEIVPDISWSVGLDPAIATAITMSGGPDSAAGAALLAQFKPSTPEPVVEVDPFAGLPDHVKPAVMAAGGLGTPTGDQVFKLLTGKDLNAPPAKPKRTTKPKETVAAVSATVVTQPAVQAVQQPSQQAQYTGGAVVSSTDQMGLDLSNLLATAMGVAPAK